MQIVPIEASAEIVLPCSRGTAEMCGFNDVFTLINSLIKFFLTTVMLPIMIVLISYAGFLFMTSGGDTSKRATAKKIFKNMAIGVLMVLFAWSIVYLVFKVFKVDTSRGRAGLSDETIDWQKDAVNNTGISAPNLNLNNGSGGTSTGSTVDSNHTATINFNVADPSNSRATVTITPKSTYRMAVRMICSNEDRSLSSTGENFIELDSSVTTIVLNLEEETEYTCMVENIQGTIKLSDPTDGEITTPRVSPLNDDFKFLGAGIRDAEINIGYRNAGSLFSPVAYVYCIDTATNTALFPKSSVVLDRSPGRDVRQIQYFFPIGMTAGLTSNVNVNCSFYTYVKDGTGFKENENKFSGFIASTKETKGIITKFLVTENQIGPDSVTLIFNGSVNINPSMNLVCVSNNSNHVLRSRVTFDPTSPNVSRDESVSVPINIPVAWNGYGLRPGSQYLCNLEGETLPRVIGYEDQIVVKKNHTFSLVTPMLPPPKIFDSKLNYHVSIGSPRVVYVNYPYVKPVDIFSSGPYLSQSQFRQPIPDAMFVPVTNGLVVDSSQMNMSCTSIMGVSAGSIYSTLVTVSETQDSNTTGISNVYGGLSLGSGFSIPITRTPVGGFMHSSAYVCMLGFTVEGIPQVRSFIATVPISIDPTEIGPVVLAAENISANNSYANFTIVASPRIENSVNYTCSHSSGNYTGESFWPPQALGIRMPVAIPVLNNLPGLKPNTTYNCVLAGSTFQKERVEYPFIIKTP